MTESTVVLAVGCVLQVATTELVPDPEGWREALHLEVEATPRCATVTLPMPPHAVVTRARARARYIDGTRQRLGEERWHEVPPDLSGQGTLALRLPDLWEGDVVHIDVERRLPAGPVAFRAGGARSWSVRTSSEVEVTTSGEATKHPRRAIWTTRDAPDDLVATARFDEHVPLTPAAALAPPRGVSVERSLVLQVPKGDPQVALFPGGGSSQRVEVRWTVDPSDEPSGLRVPAPRGAQIHMEAQPARVAELQHDAGVPRVRVAPFEGRARITVSWTEPDAPTFGRRHEGEASLTVQASGGRVAWEGDTWRLVEVHGRPVLPDRKRLLLGLQARFRAASLPEPATPADLRGQAPSWALAEALLPALEERALVADWRTDPLWPRKLLRARRSRVVTTGEAALILAMWARQLGFEADWALVHPRPGEGPVHSPAGYEHMVVRLRHQGEERWIDPACQVCTTFELPTELQGAAAIGPGVQRTSDPLPASWVSTRGPEGVTWELTGSAALHLRQWLATVPAEERTGRLADRMAGVGARLVVSEGLAEAGSNVRLVAEGAHGEDPLALQPSGATDLWLPWLGTRTVVVPGADYPVVAFEGEALSYQQGGERATLTVLQRSVPAADLELLREARSPTEPEPAP